MQPIRLIQYMILILSLLKALGLITGTEVHEGRQATNVPSSAAVALTRYVDTYEATTNLLSGKLLSGHLLAAEMPVTFAKDGMAMSAAVLPPTKHALPAELVATWYTGALPLTDIYDPITGSWRAQNGLGESYSFNADGDYTYAAFLRLQNGLCLTEVSTYRTGKAHAVNGRLALVPDVAKTRTTIQCGSNTESVTDGPFDTVNLNYEIAAGANGELQLTLTGGGSTTSFARQEMVESMAGTEDL